MQSLPFSSLRNLFNENENRANHCHARSDIQNLPLGADIIRKSKERTRHEQTGNEDSELFHADY